MWIAIKSRFGGMMNPNKMQKYILKKQFEGFTVSNSDGIHKGYERFQSLLSQLEIHGAGVSTEDANQKFLRSLPSAWLQVSLIMRNKQERTVLIFNETHVTRFNQERFGLMTPIIEEYESDSDDDIRECGNGSREKTNKILRKPIWDNAQRVNKQHQFVPLAVQTRTGTDPVNTVKASGTNYAHDREQAYLADYQDINVRSLLPWRDIIEFCGLKGIKREYSNARTPQQNGVAERKNRTLIEAARTMLADSFLPNTFWAEAVSTAPPRFTPNPLAMFLTGKGPNWLFDLDYLTDSMNYLSVSSENQANIHAGQQETNQNEGSKDKIVAGDSDKEDESAQDCFEVPYWHSYSSTNTSSSKSDEKRRSPREEEQVFLDDLARLQRQEKEANEEAEALTKNLEQDTEKAVTQAEAAKTSSTNIISTVSTTAKASGTNIVNTVSIPVGTASTNEGLSLSNTTNSQDDDYEIPPLEEFMKDATDVYLTHYLMMMRVQWLTSQIWKLL
ncbi:putative ribonuclease H-like domain-containing protein [Tanacetum coccineum]